MNSKAVLHGSLSHLGFPGNLITSQICSPMRMTNLLKQVSQQILLLAFLYNSWMHPGSCQLPQELSQVSVTVTGSQLVISTVTATGQGPTVLIPDEVTITLGYQSLLPTYTIFHTYTTLSPIYGAPETVPQFGGNSLRNRKELSPSLTFIGWSCILVILEGSTTGLGRLSVSRIFCHWGGRPTNLPSFGSKEVWTRCSKFCGAEISGRFFFFLRNMVPEGEKATPSVPV